MLQKALGEMARWGFVGTKTVCNGAQLRNGVKNRVLLLQRNGVAISYEQMGSKQSERAPGSKV